MAAGYERSAAPVSSSRCLPLRRFCLARQKPLNRAAAGAPQASLLLPKHVNDNQAGSQRRIHNCMARGDHASIIMQVAPAAAC